MSGLPENGISESNGATEVATDASVAAEASSDESHFSTMRFADLELAPSLQQGVADAGFELCTPIQAKSLPLVLAGTDVQGQAQTGTGKTAAFLLATMQRLLTEQTPNEHRDGDPRAIILAPTRELAIQIAKDAEVLGAHTGLRTGVVFGGTGYDTQRQMLEEGLEILVGTPGRLIDYFKQRIFSLHSVQVVVLDEADRMFDLGFINDIRYVLRRMPAPEKRLNMLFSATLSQRVAELAYEHMNEPVKVDIAPDQVTVEKITQVLFHVSKDDKIPLLLGLLKQKTPTRTMIFINTKRVAERLSDYLKFNGYDCALLTGDVPQTKRMSLLARFTRGELPILVATDVAARGLHIPDVTHVINYDLPQDAEDYVHRVGRTARAGATGDALSFACEEYVYSLMDIEKFIGLKIPVENFERELLVEPKEPPRRPRKNTDTRKGGGGRRHGGGGGGRPRGANNGGR
ncbi:MAG: ATP-dependent RNA helicase RhlB [Gammaproteobacteria bacterium]|jgi:ATP-dependent RNA helicase RhlB